MVRKSVKPLPLSHPDYERYCEGRLLKTLWKKEKMLVTSIFSFSCDVFHPTKELSPNVSSVNALNMDQCKVLFLDRGLISFFLDLINPFTRNLLQATFLFFFALYSRRLLKKTVYIY